MEGFIEKSILVESVLQTPRFVYKRAKILFKCLN